ncbi:MAG: adenylosuccinate lyase [Candidatus Levybacteria bacterium]|nr:adenylosuccinate lyase [Candidatus Levybacteria bacterium]MDZ4228376.1 adenylosuccinate lyase [Candidatus Levybacteria bacterium]
MASPEQSRTERPIIPNVLADRYASTPMVRTFSPEDKVIRERELWIAVMQAQRDLGLNIPQASINAYKAVKDNVDLDSIRRRELKLRHDEKARLEEFNALAGQQNAHEGLTSRDMSDNIEQMEIRDGLVIVRDRAVATLARLSRLALENSELVYAGRTHNAPAQPSLVGKLFSDSGEELLRGFDNVEKLIETYPLRGIKGAMGTQTDQLQLFDGDAKKVAELEKKVAEFLGFKNILGSVGQIYPRSLDFEFVSTLFQLVSGPASLADTLRHMAGNEQFTEGFKEGQVGSSAMPHKMNSRTLERIEALKDVLDGHLTMAKNVSGRQRYGGDVSDSATRRVFIPDSFFTTDGLFQAMLTVLDECGFYPAVINRELEKYLPFLTTTRLLMTAVKNGVGREKAHSAIRDHSVKVALDIRAGGEGKNDLLDRLAGDPRLGLSKEQLQQALSSPIEFVGTAPQQIKEFAAKVDRVVKKHPQAASYEPEEIL